MTFTLHITARHAGPGEAPRAAMVYLREWCNEGQRPCAALLRPLPHSDRLVHKIEGSRKNRFRHPDALTPAVKAAGLPEPTLKRRFKSATGIPLMEYVKNFRIERGRHLLKTTALPAGERSVEAGYSEAPLFRRLFKSIVRTTPLNCRRLSGAVTSAPRG